MGSQLTGQNKTLTWADFTGPVPPSNPDNLSAFTKATFTPTGITTKQVPDGAGKSWQLQDTFTITVALDGNKSWALASIKSDPQSNTKLLNHEQGHYNLAALLGRDMFVEMQQLLPKMFPTQNDLNKAIMDIHTRYKQFESKIGKAYDDANQATNHGANAIKQQLWDGYIKSATTQTRTPSVNGADGMPLKEEIVSVLKKNGIQI